MLISCIWGLAEAVSSAVCSAAAGLRSIVRSGADAGEVRVVAKESAMLALWAVGKGTRSAMELFQAAAYRLEALGSAIEHHASNNSMAAVAAPGRGPPLSAGAAAVGMSTVVWAVLVACLYSSRPPRLFALHVLCLSPLLPLGTGNDLAVSSCLRAPAHRPAVSRPPEPPHSPLRIFFFLGGG